jgi:hypothetical protein
MHLKRRLSQLLPVLTLLFVSPIVVELLFGSTYITIISSLLPEIGFYGGGALIIRYIARRQNRGWFSILLLGMAFAVFEEFLVVQTSVSPVLFTSVSSSSIYGRVLGVNWVYFLWAVGYENVWGIVLPISLTEIIFPAQRKEQWLGKTGLAVVVVIFVFSSVISWYIWTQVVVPSTIGFVYSPSPSLIVLSLVMIAVLATIALGPWTKLLSRKRTSRKAPSPWIAGSAFFGLGLAWFALIAFTFDAVPNVPSALALSYGVILAGTTPFLASRIRMSIDWQDSHSLAIICGGLGASMLAGFWASGIVLTINIVGKIIFNMVAVGLLWYLALKVRGRRKQAIVI